MSETMTAERRAEIVRALHIGEAILTWKHRHEAAAELARVAELEARLALADRLADALKLIGECGGRCFHEEVAWTATGSWCAEQARTALDAYRAGKQVAT